MVSRTEIAVCCLQTVQVPMTCFNTKAMVIIIIDLVSVELLYKHTRTCLTGYTGSIHMNAIETERHTCILTLWTKVISRNHSYTSLWPACAKFTWYTWSVFYYQSGLKS